MVSYEVGRILIRMRFIHAIRKLRQQWKLLQPAVQLNIPYIPMDESQFELVLKNLYGSIKQACIENPHVLKDECSVNLLAKIERAYISWINKPAVYIHDTVTKPFSRDCDTEQQFILRWYGLLLAAEHNIRAIADFQGNQVMPKIALNQISMININEWRLKLLESLMYCYSETREILQEHPTVDIKNIFHWSFVIINNDYMSLNLSLYKASQNNKKMRN